MFLSHFRLAIACAALIFTLTHTNAHAAQDKLSALSNKQLASLVVDLDGYFKQSLDVLYTLHKDEAERQIGLKFERDLMANYDARVAGKCTNVLMTQAMHQYILGALGRMMRPLQEDATTSVGTAPNDVVSKQVADYVALLLKFGVTKDDVPRTNECSVFEYDIEPLYESPITVADPGWWIFGQKDTTKTFIRLMNTKTREDGSVELEAYVGGGRAKGRYTGVATRNLRSTEIEVSLMRAGGSPMLIDGKLTMSGNQYQDPITNQPAPKMPARTLTGLLTIHDGKFTVQNSVMFLARESDATIGNALGGFKVPGDAKYGTYLNIVVASFRGRDVRKHYLDYVSLMEDAYKSAQKDNPVQNFHPTTKPLFVTDDEAAFVVIDIASDVNALAARNLRSKQTFAKAKALGATAVEVFPFYKVSSGKLRVKFAGRPAAEMKYSNTEGLAKALLTMFAALQQEQARIYERYGITKLSQEVATMQSEIDNAYKALGTAMRILLDGQAYSEELDQQIGAKVETLVGLRDKIMKALASILDDRKTEELLKAYEAYFAAQKDVYELAMKGVAEDRREADQALLGKINEGSVQILDRVKRFGAGVTQNKAAIESCLNFMLLYSVRIELGGTYVNGSGKTNSFTWKWERTLSSELETFFNGGQYDEKSSRAGRAGN